MTSRRATCISIAQTYHVGRNLHMNFVTQNVAQNIRFYSALNRKVFAKMTAKSNINIQVVSSTGSWNVNFVMYINGWNLPSMLDRYVSGQLLYQCHVLFVFQSQWKKMESVSSLNGHKLIWYGRSLVGGTQQKSVIYILIENSSCVDFNVSSETDSFCGRSSNCGERMGVGRRDERLKNVLPTRYDRWDLNMSTTKVQRHIKTASQITQPGNRSNV